MCYQCNTHGHTKRDRDADTRISQTNPERLRIDYYPKKGIEETSRVHLEQSMKTAKEYEKADSLLTGVPGIRLARSRITAVVKDDKYETHTYTQDHLNDSHSLFRVAAAPTGRDQTPVNRFVSSGGLLQHHIQHLECYSESCTRRVSEQTTMRMRKSRKVGKESGKRTVPSLTRVDRTGAY